MQRKQRWRGYFTFSRRERNVGMYLMILIVFVTITPFLLGFIQPEPDKISPDIIAQLNYNFIAEKDTVYPEFERKQFSYNNAPYQQYDKNKFTSTAKEIVLFPFDPNTISKQEWIDIGIAPFVAERLVNYVSKGYRYRTPDDLLKTYGFQQTDLDRLRDYIKIDSVSSFIVKQEKSESMVPVVRVNTNINHATKEQLSALGFTSDNAMRIIKFREAAGGIYNTEQLNSVYGIDVAMLEEIKSYLIIEEKDITKINVNTCTFEQLAAHLYISDELAQAIIDYRTITGKFYSVAELRKVTGMYASLFEKMKPYLIL